MSVFKFAVAILLSVMSCKPDSDNKTARIEEAFSTHTPPQFELLEPSDEASQGFKIALQQIDKTQDQRFCIDDSNINAEGLIIKSCDGIYNEISFVIKIAEREGSNEPETFFVETSDKFCMTRNLDNAGIFFQPCTYQANQKWIIVSRALHQISIQTSVDGTNQCLTSIDLDQNNKDVVLEPCQTKNLKQSFVLVAQ